MSTSNEVSVLEKVAALTTLKLTQQQIAKRLGLSQSTISRRLEEAYESDLIRPGFPVWSGTKERLEEVNRLLQPSEELKKLLRGLSAPARNLLEVQIVEDASQEGHLAGVDFGRRTGRFLLDHRLPREGLIGVAWGGMLLNIALAIERTQTSPLPARQDLYFMPICGDPPEVDENPMRSAANIAAHLERAITGKTDYELSFSSVTACIPAGFEKERADTLRDFFRTFPGYRAIFGSGKTNRDGAIQRLTGVLTSLGTNQRNVRWLKEAARAAGSTSEELAAASAGNIGGIFVARRDADQDATDLIDRVNARWTGIRLAHLKKCAKAAASDEDRLGVVMIAGRDGEQRDIVIECVRQGLANRLFLSPDTAAAILEALTSPPEDDDAAKEADS